MEFDYPSSINKGVIRAFANFLGDPCTNNGLISFILVRSIFHAGKDPNYQAGDTYILTIIGKKQYNQVYLTSFILARSITISFVALLY